MKNRLLTISLSMLLALPIATVQAQWRDPQSTQIAILNASTELKKHYAHIFMNAFKNLCLSSVGNYPQLLTQLQNAQPLSPNLADLFLNGAQGKAWALENSKENGIHFLAIMNNHYHCATYTMVADPAEMQRLFEEITTAAPPESEFTLLKDEEIEQPDGNIMHRKSYALTNKNTTAVIQFTIITNSISQKDNPQGIVFILIDQI